MSDFDSFDFSSSAEWQLVAQNLYIPPGPNAERLLTKRKQRWYKENIDPTYVIEEPAPLPSSNQAAESASTAPPFTQFKHHTASVSGEKKVSGAAAPSSASRPAPSAAVPRALPPLTLPVILSYVQLGCHVTVLLLAVFLAVPFLSSWLASIAFPTIVQLSLVANLLTLVRSHGRPRLTAEFAQQLARDEAAHHTFYALILLSAPHALIYVLPFIVRSAIFAAGALRQLLPAVSLRAHALLLPYCETVISQAGELQRMNAMFEILAFGYTLILIVTPSRSLLLVFLLGQYLRIRYMLSPESQSAWTVVRTKCDEWASKQFVPGSVRGGYETLKAMLARQGDPQNQQRCSIM